MINSDTGTKPVWYRPPQREQETPYEKTFDRNVREFVRGEYYIRDSRKSACSTDKRKSVVNSTFPVRRRLIIMNDRLTNRRAVQPRSLPTDRGWMEIALTRSV